MGHQTLRRGRTPGMQGWYERVLAQTSVTGRILESPEDGRVHLLESGAGPPAVLLHGSGLTAGFFLPLLDALDGVRVLAPDLPGAGMSDPVDLPRHGYHDRAVAWLDGLLDLLGLDTTAVVGHSGGAVWALRYALAHPSRVSRLVLVGAPSLPGTRCPLPQRLVAMPGLGTLLTRVPATPASVVRLARVMGEGTTLPRHPDLVDMFVVAGRDPVSTAAFRADVRALVSPLALFLRSGWRAGGVRPEELRALSVPTLVLWGERDPLGDARVAEAVTELIPEGRLRLLPAGHGPWLGEAAATAAAVRGFVR